MNHPEKNMDNETAAALAALQNEVEHTKIHRTEVNYKLDRLLEICTPLNGLEPRVRKLEDSAAQVKGAGAILIFVGSVVGALGDFILHKIFPSK